MLCVYAAEEANKAKEYVIKYLYKYLYIKTFEPSLVSNSISFPPLKKLLVEGDFNMETIWLAAALQVATILRDILLWTPTLGVEPHVMLLLSSFQRNLLHFTEDACD